MGPVGASETAPNSTYAVVVDVLSFTTTLSVAMDLGTEVLPHRWRDDSAAELARTRGATLAVGRREARATFDALQGSLPHVLRACASGQELIGKGFGEDVDVAAELDASPHVPVLRGDGFVRAPVV